VACSGPLEALTSKKFEIFADAHCMIFLSVCLSFFLVSFELVKACTSTKVLWQLGTALTGCVNKWNYYY